MQADRRSFVAAMLGAGAALSLPGRVLAEANPEFTLVNPPQPTDVPGKIEVLEFFSYGCPHCRDFNPLLGAWAAKLPSDVVFRKVPITFGRGVWETLARLYYALEVTGDLKRLDNEAFKALHDQRVPLMDERSQFEWVGKMGVDPTKYAEAYKSFSTGSRVKRGDQLAAAYRITGVPSLAVDGKYMVGDRDFQEKLAIADKLIAKARAEKKK